MAAVFVLLSVMRVARSYLLFVSYLILVTPAMLFVAVSLNQISSARARTGSNQGSLLTTDQCASHCSGDTSDECPFRPAVVMSSITPPLCKTVADEKSEQQNQSHQDGYDAFI